MVDDPARVSASRSPSIGVGALLLLIASACLGGAAVTFLIGVVRPAEPEPAAKTEVKAGPSVIIALRDLATLETASAHIERVIDLRDKQTHLFGLVESEDALLLVAAADVIAGFNLGELREEDVQIDASQRSAELLLPPVRVLSARLDNQRTYVHSRQTGALAQRAESLEARARVEAEKTLREAAVDAGLLERGRQSAERTIAALVRSLGYDRVTIRFRKE